MGTSLLAVPMPADIKEQLEQLWSQHIENVSVQTYVLPYNEQHPQPEGRMDLTLEELEKLGSPVIYADLEHKINAGQPLTTPIDLYFIDYATLVIFKKIIANEALTINEQHPQSIANVLMAADAYQFTIDELLVSTLKILNDNTLCNLFNYFSQDEIRTNHPNIARLIHQAIQQKKPFQYQHTGSITIESPVEATDASLCSITTNAAGNRIVRGGYLTDANIRTWNLINGTWQPAHTIARQIDDEQSLVALSSNGNCLVTAARNYATVWELQNDSWVVQEEILGEGQDLGDYTIWSIAVNATGDRIFTGSEEQGILVWDPVDNGWELTARLEHIDQAGDAENIIVALATTPIGDRVVGGSANHTIQIWDFVNADWQLTATLGTDNNNDPELGHTDEVNALALSADGNRVVSGSRDQTIKIWDFINGKWQLTQTLNNYSGSRKETFDSGNTSSLATPTSFNYTGENVTGATIAVSVDGNRMISRAQDASINVWHTVHGLFQLQQHIGPQDLADSIALSADGSRIFIHSSDNKSITIWDEESLDEFCRRVAPELYVQEETLEEPAAKRARTDL